jgi:hypothetical protein
MVYLRVKENSIQAKAFLEYVKTVPFVEIIEIGDIPNSETKKAINDARNGKLIYASNVDDLIKKLSK